MNYRDNWDLSTVPEDRWLSEHARRLRAKNPLPPRAKVLRPCPKCGHAFGGRDLRTHLPKCKPTSRTR